ncbi:MAG: carboxypeptidase-like regulatory domain-containing protein [Planctomycetota bacterium]
MRRHLGISDGYFPHSLFHFATWMLAFVTLWLVATSSPCQAMITGGKGNKPLPDPGWPKGADKVFNWPTRIAWWEGPPFGGGQWHAESKGDAKVLNEVLEAFAEIDAPKKRLIVNEGIGYSFWLDPNGSKRADRTTKIDWEFTIWVPERWALQMRLPADMSAVQSSKDESPVPQLTIYAASVRYSELRIPKGIEIIDNRMEAHGYTRDDGRVIEGRVTDSKTGLPVAAHIQVERVTPKPTGGYDYEKAESTQADSDGKWHFKNFPDKWSRIIISAEGYAPRVAKYVKFDRQPGWTPVITTLGKSCEVHGMVQTPDGRPLESVEVRVSGITVAGESAEYKLPDGYSIAKTNSTGEFSFASLPSGLGRLLPYHPGHVHIGLRSPSKFPDDDIVIELSQAGTLEVKVKFDPPRAGGYIVNIAPKGAKAGGEMVGSWGGSSNLDENDTVLFKNIPPGEYVVHGRPNPGSNLEQTEDALVKIEGGKEASIEIKAK